MTAPEPLSSLQRAFDSHDPEERRQATARLGRGDLEAALPLLVRALGDDDWRVRKEATIAARYFGQARSLIDTMVELLSVRDNIGLRNAAVDVLAASGPGSTAALAGALLSLDADGRKLAVEALGRGRDPLALPVLEARLADLDDNVRQGVIEAIAQLGAVARERVPALLLAHLDDRDRVVRLTALEGLTALEVAIPWPRLAPLVEDPTLRQAALSAAALAESPEAARALARALGRARGGAFAEALAGLSRLADGPLAPDVAAALRDEGPALGARLTAMASDPGEPERRAMALKLAAAAGADGAVIAALAALADEQMAETAQRALQVLGAPALPAMLATLADHDVASSGPKSRSGSAAPDPSAEARAALVLVISRLAEDDPSIVPRVLGALRAAARGAEGHLASSALLSLSRLGEEADLRLAAERALSSSRPVALAAEAALAALAERFPAAARRLADVAAGDPASALPAAILIGVLGAASAYEERDAVFLAHAATGGDTRERRAAVLAVSELGCSEQAPFPIQTAIEVLSFALADEEHEVRLAAARALGRLSSIAVPERASEILSVVDRTGAVDLLAGAVRAIGEGMSLAYQERRSFPPAPPNEGLVTSLAQFARGGQGSVAIAAVDALGLARLAGSTSAVAALAAALDHPDVAVAKAALLTLAAAPGSADPEARGTLDRALDHPSASVRVFAVELIAEADHDPGRAASSAPSARERLARRLAIEADRDVRAALEHALSPSVSFHDDGVAPAAGRGEGGR